MTNNIKICIIEKVIEMIYLDLINYLERNEVNGCSDI